MHWCLSRAAIVVEHGQISYEPPHLVELVGADVRQGPTADRTSFSDRVRRLMDPEQSRPRALLALMPDEARLRQSRRLLGRYPDPVYLALERDARSLLTDDGVWHGTSTPARLSLEDIFARLRSGGTLTWEPRTSRLSLPDDADMRGVEDDDDDDDVTDHLLPALLKPGEKRVLECLADWPLIDAADLGGILGLSPSGVSKLTSRIEKLCLLSKVVLDGRRRLALSDGGLSLLARRDRVSVGAAVRRWSVETMDGQPPSSWRDLPGTRARPLARTIEHTQAVHRFMAALAQQAKGVKDCRVVLVSPPHHATRYFRYGGSLRSIHPDGFGVVQIGSRTMPFFLEYERRAVNPSTMAARLAPYLRYYSSNRPLEDHGERPLVLIVFEDSLAEANFLGVARREMEYARVEVPLWVSHREALEREEPLGRTWRSPTVLESVRIFG